MVLDIDDATTAHLDSLYDVIIRSDVGVIDVTWSQKEAADASVKGLRLKKQKEMSKKAMRDDGRRQMDFIDEFMRREGLV